LLAVAYDAHKTKRGDTFTNILAAKDRIDLVEWLRHLPMFHVKQSLCLVHAGLIPQWSVADAVIHAEEIEDALRGNRTAKFLHHMYGKEPLRWSPDLTGWNRLRFITNVMTRIRYMTKDSSLEMKAKLSPENETSELIPWFDMPNRQSSRATIIFGHWSTLGLRITPHLISLDTGCVWGRQLSAVHLDKDFQAFQVECGDCI
jgi:bis(5'-nucleosyl)-tetraphosphatase (symmetrical)